MLAVDVQLRRTFSRREDNVLVGVLKAGERVTIFYRQPDIGVYPFDDGAWLCVQAWYPSRMTGWVREDGFELSRY